MSYLNQGGNLYLESVDIGKDHSTTDFLDYFGIKYSSDGSDYEVDVLLGDSDNFMEEMDYILGGGEDAHYSIDRLLNNGSSVLFRSEDDRARIFSFEGGNYKTVASSIVFGAIMNGDSLNVKAYLLSEIINYFLDISPITSVEENISNLLISGKNYPNPFSSQTKINYTINKVEKVRIDIFDLKGQIVKCLIDEKQMPGNYSVSWNATNESGKNVESGFYFYKISAGEFTKSEKIVLLR